MTDAITEKAIQAAKEYLQGAGPWKIDEIGIDENDPLVKCIEKAIRESQLLPCSYPAPS